MTSQHVEFARFRSQPGVSDAALREANDALFESQNRSIPGFLGRELYKMGQGEWRVVMRCRDRAAMQVLLSIFKTDPSPEMRAFGALIDRPSMQMEFGDLVSGLAVEAQAKEGVESGRSGS